ncbi:MAG: hypothetical protein K6U14_01320 [Firmicutes bacterium]|nr:hypothetical protein [Alicyclobacillaceae bacterium]MCL6496259.1 hypothetical protein [Bacillota bacterium]
MDRLRELLSLLASATSLAAGIWALVGAFGMACTTGGGCHAVSVITAMSQSGYPQAIFWIVMGLTVGGTIIPWKLRRYRWGSVLWGAALMAFFVLSMGLDSYWVPSALLCLLAGGLPRPTQNARPFGPPPS